jgi:hypothetical protein
MRQWKSDGHSLISFKDFASVFALPTVPPSKQGMVHDIIKEHSLLQFLVKRGCR